jgi:hypothetical protein
MRGAFRFEDVPLGDYTLSVHSFLDAYPWSPAAVDVTPPIENVVLFCDDLVPTSTLVFRVTDALTGAPLDGFDLHHSGAGGIHVVLNGFASGAPALTDHPDVGTLDWRITADGHAPAFGDLDDFGPPVDGVRTAEVVLRRGWATQFRIVDAKTGVPLEGAAVMVDGEVLARTDERGIARAHATAVPEHIEVRHGDWVVVRGDPADSSGDRRSLFREIALAPPSD